MEMDPDGNVEMKEKGISPIVREDPKGGSHKLDLSPPLFWRGQPLGGEKGWETFFFGQDIVLSTDRSEGFTSLTLLY